MGEALPEAEGLAVNGQTANVCTVAGFDASLSAWGWAVLTARQVRVASGLLATTWELQGCNVVTSKPVEADTVAAGRSARVRALYQRVRRDLDLFNLDALAVESAILPVGPTAGRFTTPTTMAALGQVRGSVDAMAVELGLRLYDVTPQAVKKRALSHGLLGTEAIQRKKKIDKADVIEATESAFRWGLVARFGARAEHVCDAIWVAVIGAERELERAP